MERMHAYIRGRVQGVFFRASAKKKADELSLTGWVKNLPDGRVETVYEGPAKSAEEMTEWCKRGPPGARVDDLELRREKPTGEFTSYEIIRHRA